MVFGTISSGSNPDRRANQIKFVEIVYNVLKQQVDSILRLLISSCNIAKENHK